MSSRTVVLYNSLAVLLVTALPLVAAQHTHGDDEQHMDMTGTEAVAEPAEIDHDDPWTKSQWMQSYFRHGQYGNWMLAHAVLMVFAWVFAMPLAIMLSVARSRFHLPAQVLFHILNGLGFFAGFVYNHATPDLYEGNAHHSLGWALTFITIAWTVMSLYVAYGEYWDSKTGTSERLQTSAVAQYDQFQQYNDEMSPSRVSRDSGLGNSRQNSSDSVFQKKYDETMPIDDADLDEEEKAAEGEHRGFLGNNKVDRFISRNVLRFSTQRAATVVRFFQIILEKFLLLLGFATLASGFVVYGGIFRDRQVFSGLAHYIKGAIFVFYGFLTLGRWMGAFSEFGWAWNLRPSHAVVAKWKTAVPSAEFVESFVIWLYGASNVFLEHLGNAGGAWSPQDFEHVSITILFFGGGLFGMLIESSWAKTLMNTNVEVQKSADAELAGSDTSHFATISGANGTGDGRWEHPTTYRVPMNPMPALTIMLLGMMMSAHHQASMVSTMLHSQWGGLFSAFALARAVTYVTQYLKPPTTHFASRPPSELVAAFCLTAGGLIFMNSAADSVWAIESNGLDAMTVFTITMGLTGVLLAWEIILFSIKGWAVRKERAAQGQALM